VRGSDGDRVLLYYCNGNSVAVIVVLLLNNNNDNDDLKHRNCVCYIMWAHYCVMEVRTNNEN